MEQKASANSAMELKDEEWVLQCVSKSQENCEGYLPTIWEVTRWISACEGLIFLVSLEKYFVKSIYTTM